LPEQVNRGDFVLRLSEGVQDPVRTIANYVVTRQLAASFDQALAMIKSGLDAGSIKAAYLPAVSEAERAISWPFCTSFSKEMLPRNRSAN
jgi:hypothetical protein